MRCTLLYSCASYFSPQPTGWFEPCQTVVSTTSDIGKIPISFHPRLKPGSSTSKWLMPIQDQSLYLSLPITINRNRKGKALGADIIFHHKLHFPMLCPYPSVNNFHDHRLWMVDIVWSVSKIIPGTNNPQSRDHIKIR